MPALPIPRGNNTRSVYLAQRFRQGDRTVYSFTPSPLELINQLTRPDPDREITMESGNRQISKKHAQEFADYFRERGEWVIPGIILRSPSTLEFEVIGDHEGAEMGALIITNVEGNAINILDGQHRTLGFFMARDDIAAARDVANTHLQQATRQDPGGASERDARRRLAELELQLKRLETERVSVQIYVEADPRQYRQMFADISDNALGITASVRARFDRRSVVNRALPMVIEHPLLFNRVELERASASRTSEKLLSAKHVAEIIRVANVGFTGRVGRRQERILTDEQVANVAKDALDALMEGFTPYKAVALGQLLPTQLRKTSLLASASFMRILVAIYYELRDEKLHGWSREEVLEFFTKLAPHVTSDGTPVYPGSIWAEHMPLNAMVLGGFSPNSRRQDIQAVYDTMLDWALDDAPWVAAPPPPRPSGSEIDEEEYLLAKEEIAAAREAQEFKAAK